MPRHADRPQRRRRIAAHPDRPYKTFAEAVTAAKAQPGKVSVGVLAASQALVLFDADQEGERRRAEPDPLQGRRAADPGCPGRRHRPRVSQPGQHRCRTCARTSSSRSPSPASNARRRCPTPRRSPSRASRLPVLFVVGRLCADRHAPADRRPHACRDHQGGALARRHAEVRRAVRHGDPDQLAGAVRRLPEERAGRWFKVIKDNDLKRE